MISIIHYNLKFNCKIDTWNSNSLVKRLDYKLEINLDFYVKWHPLPFFKVLTIKDVTKHFFCKQTFLKSHNLLGQDIWRHLGVCYVPIIEKFLDLWTNQIRQGNHEFFCFAILHLVNLWDLKSSVHFPKPKKSLTETFLKWVV